LRAEGGDLRAEGGDLRAEGGELRSIWVKRWSASVGCRDAAIINRG
jgi:hypothetical protein